MKKRSLVRLTFALPFLFFVACGDDSQPQVTVTRGAYNQPSIRVDKAPQGNPDELLFEMQGYVEAKDRFLQMDMIRRVAGGRLAEVFGESALQRDYQILAVGLPQSAVRSLEKLKSRFPDAASYLDVFSRGVNRYLKEQEAQNGDLIKNYRRWTKNNSYVPDPWRPVDSVVVAESIAFFLSSSLPERIVFGKLALAFYPDFDKLLELLDVRAIENTFILDAGPSQRRNGNARSTAVAKMYERAAANQMTGAAQPNRGTQTKTIGGDCVDRGYPFPPCVREPSYGSNNWVVSRQFSGTKQAFVANDPHLNLSFPNNFIEVALDSKAAGGKFKVRGVNLPGIPGVLIGHNERIAWALTNQPADVDDIYIDMVSSDGKSVILAGPGGTEKKAPIEVTDHILKIRNSDGTVREQVLKMRSVAQHGPVVSDLLPEAKQAVDKLKEELGTDMLVTYKWTGHPGTTEIAAIMGVNQSRNYDDFKASLQNFEVGAQNVIYADVDGNIGYYSRGNYPVRKYFNGKLLPLIPLFGWMGFEWEDAWRKDVPELYNPAAGRIVTANNDPFGYSAKPKLDNFKDYFGIGFDLGCRAKRITEMLDEKRGNVRLDDIKRVQLDTKDLLAVRVGKLLEKASPNLKLSAQAEEVKKIVIGYDGNARRERREPLVYQTFIEQVGGQMFTELKEKLLKLEGGRADAAQATLDELTFSQMGVKTVYHKLNDGLNAATVDPNLYKKLEASLEATVEKLKVTGDERWGQANRLNLYSPLAGIFPTFVTAPIERNGSFATVDVASPRHGPNFRLIMVLEEGKPITGVNVIAGGNSSPSEGTGWLNELMMWRDGVYRDLVPFAN